MRAEVDDGSVTITWHWDGVEANTEWALWSVIEGQEVLVRAGTVSSAGPETVLTPLPTFGSGTRVGDSTVLYELRVRDDGAPWSTIASDSVVIDGTVNGRLVIGSSVVARALVLDLRTHGTALVVDASGRRRAELKGVEIGLTNWDLRDARGIRLESGVYLISSGSVSERFVVLR